MKIGTDFGPFLQARERSRLCRRAERAAQVTVNDIRRAWARLTEDARIIRAMLARPAPDPVLSDLLRLMVEDCLYDAREDRRLMYVQRRRAYLRKGARA
jgi:hypothetical protein